MAQGAVGMTAGAAHSLWGSWVGEVPDSGQIIHFVFTPDGIVAIQRATGSRIGRYSVDATETPAHLDIHWSDNSGAKAIFEVTHQTLYIEGSDAQTRPTNFDDKVTILKKAGFNLEAKLLGNWITTNPNNSNQMMYITFAPNGVFKIEGDRGSKEGTYSVDWTKNPAYLDTTLGNGAVDQSIFQITDAGILMEDGGGHARPKSFTAKAVMLKRAEDVSAELSSGHFTAADPPLWGDWVGEDPHDGQVLHLVFTPNGMVELQRASGFKTGKYGVDLSKSPALVDMLWNDNSGIKAIFDLNNKELNIEQGDMQIRPQTFTASVLVLRRADPALAAELHGSWVGEAINGSMAGGNFAFAGKMRLLTFASGGVIKSAETGHEQGAYAVDGNKNPAYLDIKWGNGAVEEFSCRFQHITKPNVPAKEVLIILPGRGEKPSLQTFEQMETYTKVSSEQVKQISATLHLGQNQPQAAPTSRANSINRVQGQTGGAVPNNFVSPQAGSPIEKHTASSSIPGMNTYQLINGASVSGNVVLFNDVGVTLRMPGGAYTNIVWPMCSQESLRQLSAQNPKIKPLVETFIETPPHIMRIPGMWTVIPRNSDRIAGVWHLNVNASIGALLISHPRISAAELQALRSLWSDAYNRTVFVAAPGHQAFLENIPRFKVERGAVTVAGRINFQGQWSHAGSNYDLSLSGNGQTKSMSAHTHGPQLTIKSANDVWVFEWENFFQTNGNGTGGILRIASGTGSFASVSDTNKDLHIVAGAPISGTIVLKVLNSDPANAIAPLIYTPSWGDPSNSWQLVNGWTPTGVSVQQAQVALIAPTAPGLYHIVFAFAWQRTGDQVASATDWAVGHDVWNDGNDIAGLNDTHLAKAEDCGYTSINWLGQSGFSEQYVPMDVLTIEVAANTDQSSSAEKPVIVSQISKPIPQPVKNEDSQSSSPNQNHISMVRYTGWCIAALAIIGMARLIFRLVMPRQDSQKGSHPGEK